MGKTYWLKDGARLTEENIRKSLEKVLGFLPAFEANMDIKNGCMKVVIESLPIQKEKISKIVKIISESNFDVYNLYKAQQLQIIIETKK